MFLPVTGIILHVPAITSLSAEKGGRNGFIHRHGFSSHFFCIKLGWPDADALPEQCNRWGGYQLSPGWGLWLCYL